MKNIAKKETRCPSAVTGGWSIRFLGLVSLATVVVAVSLQATAQSKDINLEMMLESILRSAPTGIGLVENRVIVQVNDYILELTGYSRDELIGQNARIFYPTQEDYDYVGKEKYRQISEKGTGSVETRWQRKDGEIRYVLLSSTPLDLNDLSAGVTFTVLDITDRKRAETALITRTRWFMAGMGVFSIILMALLARLIVILRQKKHAMEALRQSEEDLAITLQSIGEGVITTDARGMVSHMNPVAEELCGCLQAAIQGKPFSEVFRILNALTRAPIESPVHRVLETGEIIGLANHTLLQARDGNECQITYNAAPIRDRKGNITGMVMVFHDVTEAFLLAEKLAQSERRLDLAMAVKNEGVWDWNLLTDETYFDDRYYTMAGYEPNEFPHNFDAWAERVHPEDIRTARKAIEAYLGGKTDIYDVEFRFLRRDGDWIWIRGRGKIVERDPQGVPLRMIGAHTDITVQKHAEEALRASETKHRRLFETMTQGVVYQAADGTIISANPAAEKILGITLDQMRGKTSMDPRWKMIREDGTLVPGEEHPIMVALRTGKTTGPVTRGVFHPDKNIHIWLSITAVPLFHPDENIPFQAYATFDDITERIQAERALHASEEKLAALFSSMTEIVVLHELVFDEQGEAVNYRILDCNTAFTESTGIERKNVLERLATEVYDAPVPPYLNEYARVALTGAPCQFTAYFAPMEKYFSISVVSPRKHQFATISVDITERKQVEARLQEFKTAVEQSRDGIAITDMEGRIRFVNEAWAATHGYSSEELIDQHLSVFHNPEQMATEVLPFLQRLRETGACTGEIGHVRKDGQIFAAWMTTTVLKMADQQPFGIFALMRDITEQKQAEEEREKLQAQLRQSQKLESVGRLAGGVAHDFNNMLGAILGYAEMALDRVTPDDPIHGDLEEIYKAAQRSADLTRQLLAFARKQTIAPKELDLNETIEDALKMLRRLIGEDIHLAWRPGVGLWPVKMDPSQVDQILANLCVNARDAIRDVGRITIETTNVFFEEEQCNEETGFIPGAYVLIAVSDNGCGMDRETLANIFEPFFTTKPFGEGTGLGLATVYGAVRQNNGFINVYSEPERGTTFKVYLPRHVASIATAAQPVNTPAARHGNETILLVEDEPAILKMTKAVLDKHGYTVLAAQSPTEAIRLINEHSGQVHLLITDVVMPEMNGRDLSRNLALIYPEVRCLFMSGYTANAIAHHGVLDEGVHFIQKPFRSKDLAAKVRTILDHEQSPPLVGDVLDVQ